MQAVLFDADGVIMNGKPFTYHLETDHGITEKDTAPFFQDVFHHCLVGAKDLKQEISPYLEKWGWDKSVDEFLLYWFDSENVIDHQVLSHIRELRKKKITCALATNQEKYRTEYIIERMYFKDKFDHVYASAHIGVRKPDSGFYEHIHEQLGFPKEEIVFWDDNEENVRAAESYGFQAFVFEGYKPYLKQMKKILAQP